MSTSEEEEARRRAALDKRIAEAREPFPNNGFAGAEDRSSLTMAFRVGAELVAALVVGFLVGWVLDRWFGTRPFLMFAFVFLGIGAGMVNVYRVMNGYGLAVGYVRRGEESSQKLRGQADGAREKNAMVETAKHGQKRD